MTTKTKTPQRVQKAALFITLNDDDLTAQFEVRVDTAGHHGSVHAGAIGEMAARMLKEIVSDAAKNVPRDVSNN